MTTDDMASHHGAKTKLEGNYPNETMRLLIERASCRSFADKDIPDDILNQLFEAGTHAPTGGNLQPFSIIKIKDSAVKTKLAKMCEQDFIGKAPVDLLFCIDWYRLQRWAEIEIAPFTATGSFRHFWISFQDTIIAAQNICTAADALGLGSVYIGTVMEYFRELKTMFDLPNGVFPVVLLCLGYPKEKPLIRRKLGIDVIVHDEHYRRDDDAAIAKAYDNKYPDIKIVVSNDKLDNIRKVCIDCRDKNFADECLSRIEKNGYINMAQRYFGLHYEANKMPLGNIEFQKIFREYGFAWFKKWERERP